MPRYRIKYQVGQYGETEEIIECFNQEQADKQAYEACLEEAQSVMKYSATLIED